MAFDPSTATLADDNPLGSAVPTPGVGYTTQAAPTAFDPSTATLADDTSSAPDATVGRTAGSFARGVVGGVAGLPQMGLDALNSVNTLDPHSGLSRAFITGVLRQPDPGPHQPEPDSTGPYSPQLSDFVHPEKWKEAAQYFAERGGLPHPSNPVERVANAAGEAVPSAVLAPEAPILGAVSAGLGGAASQTVKEAGGSPLAQTLAGLAAGSVPALGTAAAGLTRLAVRGGAEGAAAMNANLDNAAANNIPLTVGQASGSKLAQTVEAASGKIWGGGAIDKNAATQTSGLQSRVGDIVDNLSGGTTPSPTAAGDAINAGAATTKTNMRAAEKAAYDRVDTLVPPHSPVDVSGALSKLEELASPTPGAANTTGALISPKIVTMRDNLKADIAANGGSTTIPYSAATDLKTKLNNSIDWGFSPSNAVENGALKQVHGALKGDIDTAASSISPDARQAVADARTLYAHNQARRDFLNSVIDNAGGPESVYAAATNGTKLGATKIDGVMSALDPGQQNLVRATVLDRLGRAVPSAQNAAGSAFDADTFLTNWGKLDTLAKDKLFGTSGVPKDLRASLDSLNDTMTTLKNSNALKNPSGTAKAGGHAYGLWGLLTEMGTAASMGHFKAAALSAVAAAGGAGTNALLARALVNPKTARWLATTTKLPKSAIPNAINQLSKMGKSDPDARDLASALGGTQ